MARQPLKFDELCCSHDINPELVALLGVLTVNYNYAERMLRIFLEEYLSLDTITVARISHSMADAAVINLCRALISEKEKDQDIKSAGEHYLSNFGILTENRNIAMHSLVFQAENGGFTFSKRTRKGDLLIITIIQGELELCCKELKELFHFGATLLANFENRRNGERRVKLLPPPPPPRKLHLRQLSQDSEIPPLQSSEA